jgi:hypothetical protein
MIESDYERGKKFGLEGHNSLADLMNEIAAGSFISSKKFRKGYFAGRKLRDSRKKEKAKSGGHKGRAVYSGSTDISFSGFPLYISDEFPIMPNSLLGWIIFIPIWLPLLFSYVFRWVFFVGGVIFCVIGIPFLIFTGNWAVLNIGISEFFYWAIGMNALKILRKLKKITTSKKETA